MLVNNKLKSSLRMLIKSMIPIRVFIALILYVLAIFMIIVPGRWVEHNNLLTDGTWGVILLIALILFCDFVIIHPRR